MNKLFIIEGTDNSGKDTLIKNLQKFYSFEKPEQIHFSRPRSRDNVNAALEQNESFIAYANIFNEVKDRFVIFNRAWYGEYVYGTLYRGRSKDEVLDVILQCEKIVKNTNTFVIYVQLYADADFLAKHDDGQSLSEGKKEIIEEEKRLFMEIFNQSTIDKKIAINVAPNGEYINEQEILKKVIELVES